MSQLRQVPLADIRVEERLRRVDPDHVAVIAASIRECGKVLSPVTCRTGKGGQIILIAGAHRLAAAQEAGLETIPAEIHAQLGVQAARLMEIDENLCRHELTPLDRAVSLAERKVVYEQLHPETKHGGDRKSGIKSQFLRLDRFSKETQEKTRLSERSIQRAIEIAKRLSPHTRTTLAHMPMPIKEGELYKLSRLSERDQHKVMDAYEAGASVGDALQRVSGKTAKTSTSDTAYQQLMQAWVRAPRSARERFVAALKERGEDVSGIEEAA
ncbi:ParB N-terminal domain-containing protein [Pyruvatibacter mobilis]|uniref:ParB N-terminal domain-containing protein n=1 Tax=Pyruvatibacter mobilis TaxID=1712261 RepID=UPI003C7E619A